MSRKVSRRAFLKISALAAAAVLFPKKAEEDLSQSWLPCEEDKPDHSSLSHSKNVSKSEEVHDLVIIGGGIAGLAAAFFLEDVDYIVLERAEGSGGRSISGVHQGLSYAKGAEYLGEPWGALKDILERLNIEAVEIPSPMDAHFANGNIYRGEDALASWYIESSSVKEYNRFAQTLLQFAETYEENEDLPEFSFPQKLAALDDISAEAWFKAQKFAPIFHEGYNVAARGLFGANLGEVSALCVIPEFGFDFMGFEPVKNKSQLDLQGGKQGSERTSSYSFVRGITEIPQQIAKVLGDNLRLHSTVTKVSTTEDGYEISYQDKKNNKHTITTEAVLLATPAPVSLKIAGSVLTAEQKKLLGQIQYATYATVALFSDEPIFNDAFDLALPDDLFITDLYDSTWVERYYDPAKRSTPGWVATAYVAPPSYLDRSPLTMKDDEMLKRLVADLQKIFPSVQKKVKGYDITRFPYAYPVFTLGAHKRAARLYELSGINEVYFAGDYLAYPTFDYALQSGFLAAQQISEK